MKLTPTHAPRKDLGQHFLVDEGVVHRIIEAVQIQPSESVLEIGPGEGALTRGLLEQARRVVAVEIDRRLSQRLRDKFKHFRNFELVNGDILHFPFSKLISEEGPSKLVVVGNLPYYITTPVILKLVDNRTFIQRAVLMVQREVGHRIIASPGSKGYGRLSVMVQLWTTPTLLFDIPPECFRPRPQVCSSLLRLSFRSSPLVEIKSEKAFSRVVKVAFSTRRKMLKNSLRSFSGLTLEGLQMAAAEAGIDLHRRAETLSLKEFAALSNAIFSLVSSNNSSAAKQT